MKTFLLAGAAGAALILSAAAVAQPAAQTPKAWAKVQTRADVQARVAKHFTRVDTNSDGFVTRPEAESAIANLLQKARTVRQPGAMFERLDANADGTVTRAEADSARAARAAQRPARGDGMFERLDANKDGQITRAEFDTARAQRQQRMAARDKDGDGDGRPDARRNGHGKRLGAFGGRMFEMADANRDSRVSLQEATDAALRRFDMADTNRDGQITAEERQQARERMRAQRKRG